MSENKFYGAGFPYQNLPEISGKLIVVEGTDGVGRSTQTQLVRTWLENEGYAVSDTGLRRSPLTQPGLDVAKEGHTFSTLTMSLFYAADFADRLENQIIPALKAGFIVLSDRYFYSTMARAVVRGADPAWARKLYGFALIPDLVLYLRADIPTLVSRIAHGRGFSHWESGMDIRCADNLYDSFCVYQVIRCADNLYDSFCVYQDHVIKQFDQMAEEYGFITINANQSVQTTFDNLRQQIMNLFAEDKQT